MESKGKLCQSIKIGIFFFMEINICNKIQSQKCNSTIMKFENMWLLLCNQMQAQTQIDLSNFKQVSRNLPQDEVIPYVFTLILCVCMCMSKLCTYMWRQELNMRCFLYGFPLYVLGKGFSLNLYLIIWLDWLSR